MNTGIGQWKYCIPQPFSRCLFSLCSSLFDFNSILNNGYAKFWGLNKVHYGLCEDGEYFLVRVVKDHEHIFLQWEVI